MKSSSKYILLSLMFGSQLSFAGTGPMLGALGVAVALQAGQSAPSYSLGKQAPRVKISHQKRGSSKGVARDVHSCHGTQEKHRWKSQATWNRGRDGRNCCSKGHEPHTVSGDVETVETVAQVSGKQKKHGTQVFKIREERKEKEAELRNLEERRYQFQEDSMKTMMPERSQGYNSVEAARKIKALKQEIESLKRDEAKASRDEFRKKSKKQSYRKKQGGSRADRADMKSKEYRQSRTAS